MIVHEEVAVSDSWIESFFCVKSLNDLQMELIRFSLEGKIFWSYI